MTDQKRASLGFQLLAVMDQLFPLPRDMAGLLFFLESMEIGYDWCQGN